MAEELEQSRGNAPSSNELPWPRQISQSTQLFEEEEKKDGRNSASHFFTSLKNIAGNVRRKKYMALVLSGNMWHKLGQRRLSLASPHLSALFLLPCFLLALSGLLGPQQTSN